MLLTVSYLEFVLLWCIIAKPQIPEFALQNGAPINKTDYSTNKTTLTIKENSVDSKRNSAGETHSDYIRNSAAYISKNSGFATSIQLNNETFGNFPHKIPYTAHQQTRQQSHPKAFISLERYMRNITRAVGAKAAFYCDILGQPIPLIQWFRNDNKLVDQPGRIRIETGLWGSSLRVDQLRKSDEGIYVCMATNPSGQINATAYLRVTDKPNLSTHAVPSNIPLDRSLYGNVKSNGVCQTYHSNVCGKYLFGHQVFVTREYQQALIETQISKLLKLGTMQPLHQIQEKCLRKIMEVMCLYSFPICLPTEEYRGTHVDTVGRTQMAASGEQQTYTTLYLCRQDCQSIRENECSSTYEQLSNAILQEETRMDCQTLPLKSSENPYSCRSVGQEVSTALEGYPYNYDERHSPEMSNDLNVKVPRENDRQPMKENKSEPNLLPLFISVGVLLLVGITLLSVCFACRWSKGQLSRLRTDERSAYNGGFSRLDAALVHKTNAKNKREQGVGGPKATNDSERRLLSDTIASLKPLNRLKHLDGGHLANYSPSANSILPPSESSVNMISGCAPLTNEPTNHSSGQISQVAISNDLSGSTSRSMQMYNHGLGVNYFQYPAVGYNSPPLPPPNAPAPPPPSLQFHCYRNTDNSITHTCVNANHTHFYSPFTHGKDGQISGSAHNNLENYAVSDSPTAYTTLRESSYNCSHNAHSPDSRVQFNEAVESASYSQAELDGYQFHSTDYPLSQIRFGKPFGQGVFGPVYTAELFQHSAYESNSSLSVIVKTLSPGSPASLQKDFQREAELIAELDHPNVLSLLGVSMHNPPWCMIFEVPQYLDLCELLSKRKKLADSSGRHNGLQSCQSPLDDREKLHVLAQVSDGMEYLSSHRFVHRDLAARNVIVLDEKLSCKITDLGLARDCYASDYYRMHQHSLMLPIRWMPLESILYGKFTVESDVWSFGVLLWEIWSGGSRPYASYSDCEVIELLRDKKMLQSPLGCPTEVYRFMMTCWREDPQQRPSFNYCQRQVAKWQQRITASGKFKIRSTGSSTESSATIAEELREAQCFGDVPQNEYKVVDTNFGTLSFTNGTPIDLYTSVSPRVNSVDTELWANRSATHNTTQYFTSASGSSTLDYPFLGSKIKVMQNGNPPEQLNHLYDLTNLDNLTPISQSDVKFSCTSPNLGNFNGFMQATESIT